MISLNDGAKIGCYCERLKYLGNDFDGLSGFELELCANFLLGAEDVRNLNKKCAYKIYTDRAAFERCGRNNVEIMDIFVDGGFNKSHILSKKLTLGAGNKCNNGVALGGEILRILKEYDVFLRADVGLRIRKEVNIDKLIVLEMLGTICFKHVSGAVAVDSMLADTLEVFFSLGLSKRQRRIFLLYLEEYRLAEIGEIEGISFQAVSKTVRKITEKLKKGMVLVK